MNKKSLMVEMIEAVKVIYQSAWSKTPDEEKVIHVVIDATVSLLAPAAVVWAAIDTYISFSGEFPAFFYVMLVAPPSFLFMLACQVLKKRAMDHAPLLAFAVLLFSSGAVFTANEIIKHTNTDTIPAFKKLFKTPAPPTAPAPAASDGACDSDACDSDGSDNPPWGDFLLAFSAFCVMVEEFSLFGIYQTVHKRVEQVKKLKIAAAQNAATLSDLTQSAKEKHEELTNLYKDAETLYSNIERQSRDWNESRQAVLLKACGVVAIIVLALTSMCG